MKEFVGLKNPDEMGDFCCFLPNDMICYYRKILVESMNSTRPLFHETERRTINNIRGKVRRVPLENTPPHCLISLYVIHCHKRGFVLKVSAKIRISEERAKFYLDYFPSKPYNLTFLHSYTVRFPKWEKNV